jgi:hypothetical protein
MKRSVKAALFSCLVFPGVGQMYLRRFARGMAFMLPAIAGFVFMVNYAVEQALSLVGEMESGAVPLDATSIAELVTTTPDGPETMMLNIATYVIVACWVASIIDAYRIGSIEDKQPKPAATRK